MCQILLLEIKTFVLTYVRDHILCIFICDRSLVLPTAILELRIDIKSGIKLRHEEGSTKVVSEWEVLKSRVLRIITVFSH